MSVIATKPPAAFDEALALEPAGEGLWTARPDRRYWHAVGPWGGWVLGLLLKAALTDSEDKGWPVAMSAHLMGAIAEDAPVTAAVRPVRRGRSLEFWQVEVSQNDQICAQAMITFGRRRPTEAWLEASFPDAPAPESIEPPPVRPGGGGFSRMFQTRPIKGHGVQGQGRDNPTHSIIWVRDAEARPLDHVLLAAIADVFPPRILVRSPGPRAASTVTVNLYFHAPPEEIAAVGGDFILAEAVARGGGEGVCDQTATFWRRDGRLLATSEQLVWFK
jgi:acyl-CoA thioesterase